MANCFASAVQQILSHEDNSEAHQLVNIKMTWYQNASLSKRRRKPHLIHRKTKERNDYKMEIRFMK